MSNTASATSELPCNSTRSADTAGPSRAASGVTRIRSGNGFSCRLANTSAKPDNVRNSSKASSREITRVLLTSCRAPISPSSSRSLSGETSPCRKREICAGLSQPALTWLTLSNATFNPTGRASAIPITSHVNTLEPGLSSTRIRLSAADRRWCCIQALACPRRSVRLKLAPPLRRTVSCRPITAPYH